MRRRKCSKCGKKKNSKGSQCCGAMVKKMVRKTGDGWRIIRKCSDCGQELSRSEV